MQRILYVTSSLFGDQSASKQLSDEFVSKLKTRHPNSVVTVLDRSRLQSGQDVQVYRARTTGAGRKHASVPVLRTRRPVSQHKHSTPRQDTSRAYSD
jgi:FMN-dependent NADH-azoreductase